MVPADKSRAPFGVHASEKAHGLVAVFKVAMRSFVRELHIMGVVLAFARSSPDGE